MNIQHTMNLYSPSGYAMPFEADENTPIEVARNYGKHVNEKTEKKVSLMVWISGYAVVLG